MNWIKLNTILKGEFVELIPIGQQHFEDLELLARENKIEAKQLLTKLPLVIKGIVEFDIVELQPYTGFTRLMDFD